MRNQSRPILCSWMNNFYLHSSFDTCENLSHREIRRIYMIVTIYSPSSSINTQSTSNIHTSRKMISLTEDKHTIKLIELFCPSHAIVRINTCRINNYQILRYSCVYNSLVHSRRFFVYGIFYTISRNKQLFYQSRFNRHNCSIHSFL